MEVAERRYQVDAADSSSPDRYFERKWALTLLETVVQRLAGEYEAAGRGAIFSVLRFAITGEKSEFPYAILAARLSMSEEAIRVAVHRLRQRYRQLLREEVAHTLDDSAEVDGELRELRRVILNQC